MATDFRKLLREKSQNLPKADQAHIMRSYESGEFGRTQISEDSAEGQLLQRDARMLSNVRGLFENDGMVKGRRYTLAEVFEQDKLHTKRMRDSFTSTYPTTVERVVSSIANDAAEPTSNLRGNAYRVDRIDPSRIHVNLEVGAIHAADIAEGGEYPERELELEGQGAVSFQKAGVAIKATEEAIRFSQFDLFRQGFVKMGEAISRHLEVKIASDIDTNAVTLIDNNSASFRSTTGRDSAGSYNGTLLLNDLIEAYGLQLTSAFQPDSILMHPGAFKVFFNEPLARQFGFWNGGSMWDLPEGDPGTSALPTSNVLLRKAPTNPYNIQTLQVKVPLLPTLQRIILSAHLPFDFASSLTTIYLIDTNEAGRVLEDREGIQMAQWEIPERDILKAKARIFYSINNLNEGKSIGAIRNISLNRAWDFASNATYTLPTGYFGDGAESFGGADNYSGVPSAL